VFKELYFLHNLAAISSPLKVSCPIKYKSNIVKMVSVEMPSAQNYSQEAADVLSEFL